jgi:hypothetical protein
MKGSNDHGSRAVHYPNLDHLDEVGKQSIKKEGQRRRVQGDQRSRSSAGELKLVMLAPPWITIAPPRYGGIETVIAMLTTS